jgi:hypothetical protein
MTATTDAQLTSTTEDQFCDCARDGDRWLCRSRDGQGYPRACEPGSGRTCALKATITATGRDDWDRVNVRELKPCPCGRPRR